MSTPDDLHIIRLYLIASGTTLNSECGSRVYYPLMPTDFDDTSPTIHMYQLPGTSSDGLIRTVSVGFDVYGGGTGVEKPESYAQRVYQKLVDRFMVNGNYVNMQSNAAGKILSVIETQTGMPDVAPITGYPFVNSVWEFELISTG